MSADDEKKKEKMTKSSKSIKLLLDVLLSLAFLASLVFMIYLFVIPSPNEYDNPATTEIQESFPWTPNIFENPSRVGYLFFMGFLRHVALLTSHVTMVELISMVGYVFFVLFIYGIRKTFLSQEQMDIHNYIEWGIGSVIGAIIYVAGTTSVRREVDVAVAILYFSIASMILYLIRPEVGFFPALRKRISSLVENDGKEARPAN